MEQKYWKKPDGPVLLYIGGESGLIPEVIAGGHIVELAKEYGALLFAVEHRYYGKSRFDDYLKLENLHFLSSQQALADLADFYEFATKAFELSEKNKWICYGGSYPGSLSAWYRLKYPHLMIGAVASSAPVLAKTNFEGYNKVVAASLGSLLVGGSKQCTGNVNKAFEQVDGLIADRQFAKLEQDFNSCNDISNVNDTAMFVTNLAGSFMGVVQYNGQVPGLNISVLCSQMTRTGFSPYDNLVTLFKQMMRKFLSKNCTENSYKKYIAGLKNTTEDPSGYTMMRQWYYQTCTQFGYYQTCDKNTSCVFSKHEALFENLNMCQDVFDISAAEIYKRVAFTNAYYGGRTPKGTRIVFVNGSIDPWHSLSVLSNQGESELAIFIPGTSHCENMDADRSTDPPSLRWARKEVSTIVGKWLKAEKVNPSQLHY